MISIIKKSFTAKIAIDSCYSWFFSWVLCCLCL